MADDIAIKVENISKTFRLPHEKNNSIKGAVLNFYKKKKSYEKQQVLQDISFEIKKGEFFGIVGRNGSGKSTLLKLLAGIYDPGKGTINVNGKLIPFIELGVGFNPELTGRENVFLNGALLGFSRKEVQSMYKDVVDFAELHRFMDQKLKNYSSGMQVRLAFSIAIRAKGDILLLDEVLAVGDEAFQQKCYDYFDKLKAEKVTVILVTHDMSVVERYCNRALMVNLGQVTLEGSPNKIAAAYLKSNLEQINGQILQDNRKSIDKTWKQLGYKIDIRHSGNEERGSNEFKTGDEICVQLNWTNDQVQNVGVALRKKSGELIFATNTILEKVSLRNKKINYKLKLDVEPGKYSPMVGFFGKTDKDVFQLIEDGNDFIVSGNNKRKWRGLALLEHKWEQPDV
jgi:ABC-2 type transport system ATP-binding protein